MNQQMEMVENDDSDKLVINRSFPYAGHVSLTIIVLLTKFLYLIVFFNVLLQFCAAYQTIVNFSS